MVSSALRGLSNPSRCRFLAKNSLTEMSRCLLAIDSAVTPTSRPCRWRRDWQLRPATGPLREADVRLTAAPCDAFFVFFAFDVANAWYSLPATTPFGEASLTHVNGRGREPWRADVVSREWMG